MIDHHAEHDRRAGQFWRWRPSRARPCPRLVAGKRCLADHTDQCLCLQHRAVFDHARIWIDISGNHVFTTEPYDRDGGDVAAFITDMEGLGLQVTITGAALWNSHCFMLIVQP